MGRIYTAPLQAISVANAAQDIWHIATGASKRAILHGFSLTSTYQTDERAQLTLLRRSTTSASGTSVTVVPEDQGNTIATTTTVLRTATTQGTAGAILDAWAWSQQGELLYLPTPALRTVVYESSFLALALTTGTIGGTRTWSGWVKWEEL